MIDDDFMKLAEKHYPFTISGPPIFLPLTRLNEGDSIIVMRDAIDCIQGLDSGEPGCVIFLRGGHIVRAKETVDQVAEVLQ